MATISARGDHHVVGSPAAQTQHVGEEYPLLTVQLGQHAVGGHLVGRLLDQFGDAVANVVLGVAAAEQAADPADHAATLGRSAAHSGCHTCGRHGFGTPMLCSRRASSISIRRATPGSSWS